MTLSDAARTGRRFKRAGSGWCRLSGENLEVEGERGRYQFSPITAEMVVATDWEAEPLRLEVTAEDLIRASKGLEDLASKRRLSGVEFARLLSKELGLLEE